MKIMLTKIWNTLRRDGILGANKGVWRVLKPIGTGDALIITGGIGDSARFRALNVAEELNLHEIRTTVAIQNSPFLANAVDNFKIFIFHRTFVDAKIRKMIENIKRQNKEIIFETDDLLFDPQYIVNSDYFKNINSIEKNLYAGGLGAEILDDVYTKVCTTTTTFLADKLREKGKKVFVAPNKLSKSDLEIAEKIISAKPLTTNHESQTIKVGYFSGTISHNKDFATISDALMEIMEKYPQVELFLAGPLEVEDRLNRFKNRIRQTSYTPRKKHFAQVASVDINIVPLEINVPFCEAKSELKFFEAGIVKVPTVAVANRTFSEAISDGIDGFLAKNTQEWIEKLEKLILDQKLRKTIGERAYKKSLERYSNKNSNNEEYYSYLKSKLH